MCTQCWFNPYSNNTFANNYGINANVVSCAIYAKLSVIPATHIHILVQSSQNLCNQQACNHLCNCPTILSCEVINAHVISWAIKGIQSGLWESSYAINTKNRHICNWCKFVIWPLSTRLINQTLASHFRTDAAAQFSETLNCSHFYWDLLLFNILVDTSSSTTKDTNTQSWEIYAAGIWIQITCPNTCGNSRGNNSYH